MGAGRFGDARAGKGEGAMGRHILAWMTLLTVAIPLLVRADDCAALCGHCGRMCTPQKVCRIVQEKKKVPKTTYSWECEEFCIPGHSEKVGCHEECREGHCWPECLRIKKVWDWRPCCGEVKTRVKLVKKTVDEEKMVPKCVVETICPHCQSPCGTAPCLP